MMFRITAGSEFKEQEIVTLTSLAAYIQGLQKEWKKVDLSFAPDAQPHSYTGYIKCSGARSCPTT
jgi:hypothetical protein